MADPDHAVVFIDNHETQRDDKMNILTFKVTNI